MPQEKMLKSQIGFVCLVRAVLNNQQHLAELMSKGGWNGRPTSLEDMFHGHLLA